MPNTCNIPVSMDLLSEISSKIPGLKCNCTMYL